MENQTVINGFSLNPITNDAFVPESNVSGTARGDRQIGKEAKFPANTLNVLYVFF
jgi:hypothetical protein